MSKKAVKKLCNRYRRSRGNTWVGGSRGIIEKTVWGWKKTKEKTPVIFCGLRRDSEPGERKYWNGRRFYNFFFSTRNYLRYLLGKIKKKKIKLVDEKKGRSFDINTIHEMVSSYNTTAHPRRVEREMNNVLFFAPFRASEVWPWTRVLGYYCIKSATCLGHWTFVMWNRKFLTSCKRDRNKKKSVGVLLAGGVDRWGGTEVCFKRCRRVYATKVL